MKAQLAAQTSGAPISVTPFSDSVSGWSHHRSDRSEWISSEVIGQLQAVLMKWRTAFPQEDTWAQMKRGTPSLLIRVDFGVCADWDTPTIFEIEPVPQGLGIVSKLSDFNEQRVKAALKCMPNFASLIVPGVATDDHLWLDRVTLDEARIRPGKIYLVRSDHSTIGNEFQGAAINPVSNSKDKSYGVALGLWEEINWVAHEQLSEPGYTVPEIADGFVLKPTKGQGGFGVNMVLEECLRPKNRKKGDFVGKERAESLVRKFRKMYTQRFVPSIELPHRPNENVAFSLYFRHNVELSGAQYHPIAGCWISSKSTIVCMGSEATIGPLHFKPY